ncbi:MAG: metal-dependent hydrolase [Planctomycetes bacterium]|nr:metal-dependent hydrolase [Planctomycetota bacterium]
MASYKGHLAFSASLGFVYGGMAHRQLDFDTSTALLGSALTTVGGLLPDLDSDSGVPVRELFSLAAVMIPLLMWRRLMDAHLADEDVFLFLGSVYILLRYVISKIFKRLTVHRGMYHSIPAMLIAGLVVYLCYNHPSMRTRLFLTAAVMIGFLSHLVLDEMCSVDFNGLTIKLNKYAGSAVKFFSPSFIANVSTYAVLVMLGYCAILDYEKNTRTIVLPDRFRVEKQIRLSELFR